MKKKYLLLFTLFLSSAISLFSQGRIRPNVVIIITDDQGYGDLGITGNPHVNTPTIDRLAKESVRFNNFYVSPVCAPTRSSLMTGRYSLRTGVRDTYNGGAIMASEEVTIAETLKDAGYTSGIFGKWHLGDNFPNRPSDQGFNESVIHLGGGMGQVGDFTTYYQGDSSYFDPVLWKNNEQKKYDGYCSNIFADEAVSFIERNKDESFFCYLSFNAPHTPLQVPEEYYNRYKGLDPSMGFDGDGRPFPEMSERDKDAARKVYAMVENIDDNIAKVLNKLDELALTNNTIVIFMTDNGPQQRRYVGGMKGRKGSVYQGGVRVPFYLRYPDSFGEDQDIESMAAHIDILPTIADLCSVELLNKSVDGRSMLPLISGSDHDFDSRSFFSYWTRKYPELYKNISLRKGDYKLVGQDSYDAEIEDFELFNIAEDPYEENNLVNERKQTAINLKMELDSIYKDLISSPNLLDPPAIRIGGGMENRVFLSRNDASGQRGIWNQEEIFGKWYVDVEEGNYNIKYKFVKPVDGEGRLVLEANNVVVQKEVESGTWDTLELKNVALPKMKGDLIPFYESKRRSIFPFLLEIERID